MHLALEDLVRLCWSQRVQEEWISAFLRANTNTPSEQHRLWSIPSRMAEVLAHQEPVVEGYEHLIAQITLPDPDDAHVIAAAVVGKAEAILTFNLRDFPQNALDPFDLVAIHPDEYLLDLAEKLIRDSSLPQELVHALRRQRSALTNPRLSPMEFLDSLERAGLVRFVQLIRQFIPHL